MKRIAISVAVFVLWSGGMVGVGWAWRGDRAEGREAALRAAGAEAVAAQVNQTRAIEHAQAETLATIGAKHEEDRAAAATVPRTCGAQRLDGSPGPARACHRRTPSGPAPGTSSRRVGRR